MPDLTKRELEVLGLIARGHTSATIADALHIAEATVRTHVTNIFNKLGVHSRAEAVAQGMHNAMIMMIEQTDLFEILHGSVRLPMLQLLGVPVEVILYRAVMIHDDLGVSVPDCY